MDKLNWKHVEPIDHNTIRGIWKLGEKAIRVDQVTSTGNEKALKSLFIKAVLGGIFLDDMQPGQQGEVSDLAGSITYTRLT